MCRTSISPGRRRGVISEKDLGSTTERRNSEGLIELDLGDGHGWTLSNDCSSINGLKKERSSSVQVSTQTGSQAACLKEKGYIIMVLLYEVHEHQKKTKICCIHPPGTKEMPPYEDSVLPSQDAPILS